MRDANDRLYLLLALFDRRDGSQLADLVQSVREGFERSHPDMGESENRHAWDEFDRLWDSYDQHERLALTKPLFAASTQPLSPQAEVQDCERCEGSGTRAANLWGAVYYCPDCNGTGKLEAVADSLRKQGAEEERARLFGEGGNPESEGLNALGEIASRVGRIRCYLSTEFGEIDVEKALKDADEAAEFFKAVRCALRGKLAEALAKGAEEERERLRAKADEIREAIYQDLTDEGVAENALCTALTRFDALSTSAPSEPEEANDA
jgi:hypothetical protein